MGRMQNSLHSSQTMQLFKLCNANWITAQCSRVNYYNKILNVQSKVKQFARNCAASWRIIHRVAMCITFFFIYSSLSYNINPVKVSRNFVTFSKNVFTIVEIYVCFVFVRKKAKQHVHPARRECKLLFLLTKHLCTFSARRFVSYFRLRIFH